MWVQGYPRFISHTIAPFFTKMDFEESSVSELIHSYYEGKYGKGIVGLIKSIAVASVRVKNPDVLPLSVLDVSPSGNFKSRNSIELSMLFPSSYIQSLGSDFTIHSLMREYENGKLLDGRVALVNDLALLLNSKQSRTRHRLMNALAELLSEGEYKYGERDTSLGIKAHMGLIANITLETYLDYPTLFQKNTLIERFLGVFYPTDLEEQRKFACERKKRFQMKPKQRITVKKTHVDVSENDQLKAVEVADKWRLFIMSPSLTRVTDKIISLLAGHAALNGRNYISNDDWKLLEHIQPLLQEPTVGKKEYDVLMLYNKNLPVKEITTAAGYKSQKSVYNILNKYRRRGVIQ